MIPAGVILRFVFCHRKQADASPGIWERPSEVVSLNYPSEYKRHSYALTRCGGPKDWRAAKPCEIQIKLLQKIEELTLYVIDLKKENKEMKGRLNVESEIETHNYGKKQIYKIHFNHPRNGFTIRCLWSMQGKICN
jgi:hypothetical protein